METVNQLKYNWLQYTKRSALSSGTGWLFYHLNNSHRGVRIKRRKSLQDSAVKTLEREHQLVGNRQDADQVNVGQGKGLSAILRKQTGKVGEFFIRQRTLKR